MKFSFLTLNLWYGKNWKKELEFLKKTKPDIFVLQEVTRNIPRFNLERVDVFNEIKKSFPGHNSSFAPVCSSRKKERYFSSGNATFARFPLLSSEVFFFSLSREKKDFSTTFGKKINRNVLKTSFEIEGKTVSVFNTHLAMSLDFKERPKKTKEAGELLEFTKTTNPLLLAGDFNALPESETVKILSQKFSFLDEEKKPTWPRHPFSKGNVKADKPSYKIDFIFKNEKIKSKGFKVLDEDFSDHLPILANFIV